MVVQQQWLLWSKATGRLLMIVKQVPAELGKAAVGVAVVRAELWPKVDTDDHIELEKLSNETHWALKKQMGEWEIRRVKWWEVQESIKEREVR